MRSSRSARLLGSVVSCLFTAARARAQRPWARSTAAVSLLYFASFKSTQAPSALCAATSSSFFPSLASARTFSDRASITAAFCLSISLPARTAALSSGSIRRPTCWARASRFTAASTLLAASTTFPSHAASSSPVPGAFSSSAAFSSSCASGRWPGNSPCSLLSKLAWSSLVAHLRSPSKCFTCTSRRASLSFSASVRGSSSLASSGFLSSGLLAHTAYWTVNPPRLNFPAAFGAGSP
mmetsp:Transcript_37264/g.97639  ORF Transcript_37264/g.97639 Transcript_37264/m.97639 type:complete len:238 (-) Transcript_37264:2563-3276(-)